MGTLLCLMLAQAVHFFLTSLEGLFYFKGFGDIGAEVSHENFYMFIIQQLITCCNAQFVRLNSFLIFRIQMDKISQMLVN